MVIAGLPWWVYALYLMAWLTARILAWDAILFGLLVLALYYVVHLANELGKANTGDNGLPSRTQSPPPIPESEVPQNELSPRRKNEWSGRQRSIRPVPRRPRSPERSSRVWD